MCSIGFVYELAMPGRFSPDPPWTLSGVAYEIFFFFYYLLIFAKYTVYITLFNDKKT